MHLANVAVQNVRFRESLRTLGALLGLVRLTHDTYFRRLFFIIGAFILIVTFLFFLLALLGGQGF
jgi:hypothetical protein